MHKQNALESTCIPDDATKAFHHFRTKPLCTFAMDESMYIAFAVSRFHQEAIADHLEVNSILMCDDNMQLLLG